MVALAGKRSIINETRLDVLTTPNLGLFIKTFSDAKERIPQLSAKRGHD